MTDYKLTEQFIAAAMAKRTGREQALEDVRAFVEISLAMNLITSQRLENHEESAKMYELRSRGVMPTALADRFGRSRQEVHKRLKAQIIVRRTA